MEEKTADEIAAIFSAAGDSVTVNADASYSAYTTRQHLLILKLNGKPKSREIQIILKLSRLHTKLMVRHLSGQLKVLQT